MNNSISRDELKLRIITKEYSDGEFKNDIKIGNSMKAVETFYPSYNIKFSY